MSTRVGGRHGDGVGLFGAALGNESTIAVEDNCPGRVTVRWESAAEHHWAGLMFAEELGHLTLPVGWCSGTVTGLGTRGLRLVRLFEVGSNGSGEFTSRAAPRACGGYLQLIVNGYPDCQTSNIAQVPQ